MSVECGTARTSRRVETPGQARTRCSRGAGSETRGKRSSGGDLRFQAPGIPNYPAAMCIDLPISAWYGGTWCRLGVGRCRPLVSACCGWGDHRTCNNLELLSPHRVDILCQYFQNSRRRSGHRMGKSSLSPSPNLVDTCRQIPDHPKLLRPCSCQRNVGSSKAATRRV